jgi:diguanylate cyclase (GGDEF)-like protein
MRVFIERGGHRLFSEWAVKVAVGVAGLVAVAFLASVLMLAAETDDRIEAIQRRALHEAVEDSKPVIGEFPSLEHQGLRHLERSAGVSGLRIEQEPPRDAANLQSVVDRKGRIIAWLSFDPERPVGAFIGKLWPVAAIFFGAIAALATFLIWQLRRMLLLLRASDERAQQLENIDQLTGLADRRRTLELLETALAARKTGEVTTIVDLDLDRFKDINNHHGHGTGDHVLALFGERLRSSLPNGAVCGRLGGDEFIVMFNSSDPEASIAAFREFHEGLTRPLFVGGRALSVGVSAGIVQAPADGEACEELLRRSHFALQAAKSAGRGRVIVFDQGMDTLFVNRQSLESDLRQAISEGKLDIHYQPIIAAAGGRMVGVEALLRWVHPRRGPVPPLEFVKVAEETGLMGALGQFVLRRALTDAGRWPEIYVAVNLSPLQVRDRNLVEFVARLLKEKGIPSSRLMLEMTESVLIEKPEEAKVQLDALRELGVQIALDDFGTGYSSLSYLQRFSFDKLKIDRSFVEPLGRSGQSGAMIQAIVALGNALGLKILAEGVETEAQRVLLRLAGCHEMQGFLFSEAVPAQGIDAFVEKTRNRRSANSGK